MSSSREKGSFSKTSIEKETYLPDIADEKVVDIENVHEESSDSENELDADVAELPKVVREIVPLEDDPSTPVMTFRYFLLSFIFIIPGAFISTMNSYRTTSAAYSIFFVQIASHWVGKWLARVLPHKKVKIGRFSFCLLYTSRCV